MDEQKQSARSPRLRQGQRLFRQNMPCLNIHYNGSDQTLSTKARTKWSEAPSGVMWWRSVLS